MWDFMKKPEKIKPVCPYPSLTELPELKKHVLDLEQKVHTRLEALNIKIEQLPTESKKEILAYKRMILGELDVVYKKILQELSVTDPDSLATLHLVINEYKEIETSIDEKLNLMEETLKSWNEIHKPVIKEEYDPVTRELILSVEVI